MNIGTTVVLWPIVKRQSETFALGYVASRVVESSTEGLTAPSQR